MDFIKELGYLAIASRMKRLTDRFMRGASNVYKFIGADFEPRLFTVFYLIFTQESPLSISEIANSLKISHPAVIQTTQMLIKKGLIESFQDSSDRRVRRLVLTAKGREQAELLIPIWNDFEAATAELFENAQVDMLSVAQNIEDRLDEEELAARIINRIKNRQYHAIEIMSFSPEYKDYFKALNFEWLEKYFNIEELDKKTLLNPENEIIQKGGFVFFASLRDKIVGTAALLKVDEEIYEIAKMAVTEKAQGRQVGLKLTDAVVAKAKKQGAK